MSQASQEGSPFFTAAFSSLGSLPLHIVAVLIFTLEHAHQFGTLEASFVASTILGGTFLGILLFSVLPLRMVTARLIGLLLFVKILALAASVYMPLDWLFVAWFAAGFTAGLLTQSGSRLIAHSGQSSNLFLLRVALCAIFAGLVSYLMSVGGLASHAGLALAYLVLMAAFLAALIVSQAKPLSPNSTALPRQKRVIREFDAAGLAVIFLFFAGQVAFAAHIAKNLTGLTGSVIDFAWIFGSAKLLAGVACYALYKRGYCGTGATSLKAAAGMLMTVCIIMIGVDGLHFLAVFVAYEVALCILASNVMGQVAARSGTNTRSMIMVSCNLGMITGPLLGGWLAVAFGSLALGLAAIATVLITVAWSQIAARHNAPLAITSQPQG